MSIILAGFLDTRDLDGKDVQETDGLSQKHAGVEAGVSVNGTPPLCARTGGRRRSRWMGNVFNGIIVALVLVALIMGEFGLVPHRTGGFYCGDPTLSFKYDGDTISVPTLLLVSIFVPVIFIVLSEFSLHQPEQYALSNGKCRAALRNSYAWYGEYMLAFLFNLMFMDIVKFLVGEPRPHFLSTCLPDTATNCTPGEYVSKFTCTNKDTSLYHIKDASKSFPSGHTALSVFMGIYLFCYLQARLCQMRPRLLGPVLQLGVVSWTIVCSFTRITDHRHHWWDVMAGALLGTVLAYYSVVCLCKNFSCTNPQLSRSSQLNGDSGRSLDNHNSVRRLITTSNGTHDELDTSLRPANY